jgi:hypothetical protein
MAAHDHAFGTLLSFDHGPAVPRIRVIDPGPPQDQSCSFFGRRRPNMINPNKSLILLRLPDSSSNCLIKSKFAFAISSSNMLYLPNYHRQTIETQHTVHTCTTIDGESVPARKELSPTSPVPLEARTVWDRRWRPTNNQLDAQG